jgi:hypothetical protein|tara:strand:+ start:3613 stop:3813 length:201 start_codon:yes stop_codon:yes gene_type:complete
MTAIQLNKRPDTTLSFSLDTTTMEGVEQEFEVHGMADITEAVEYFTVHASVPCSTNCTIWQVMNIF